VKCLEKEEDLIEHLNKELKEKRPVLVLINWHPLYWHYFNIVGVDSERVFVLDGKDSCKYLWADIINLMDFERDPKIKSIKTLLKHLGWILELDIGRFNVLSLSDIDPKNFSSLAAPSVTLKESLGENRED